MGTSTTLRKIIQGSISRCLNSVSPGKQNIPQYSTILVSQPQMREQDSESQLVKGSENISQTAHEPTKFSSPAHRFACILSLWVQKSHITLERKIMCVFSEYCSNYSSLSPPWEEYEALPLDWPWTYDLLWPMACKLKKLCANPKRKPYKALHYYLFFLLSSCTLYLS